MNEQLEQADSPIRYQFNFITPLNFGAFFDYLRRGEISAFESQLDVKLGESA